MSDTMTRKTNPFSMKDNRENLTPIKINFLNEKATILKFICSNKGISAHEYIDSLLDKEFKKIDVTKISDVMAELEKL